MGNRCGTALMVFICSLFFVTSALLAKDELSYQQKLAIKQSQTDTYNSQKQVQRIRSLSKTAQLSEGFESGVFPPAGWAEFHTGVNGLHTTALRVTSGDSAAVFDDVDAVDSSWFVSPQIVALEAGNQLIFWENINFESFYVEHSIWVSTGSADPNSGDFVRVDSLGPSTEDVWEERVVDLSAYVGQDITLAFLYVGDFADEWYIDDITVDVPPVRIPFPLFEGFESGVFPPAGWTELHTGVDGLHSTAVRFNSGDSAAVFDDVDAVDSSWVVSPQITGIGAGAGVTFFQNQNFESFYVEHSIWVSTGSGDPTSGDFVRIDSLGPGTEDVWEAVIVDLAAYEGQNIYVAFLYVGDFADEWYIDDISVDVTAEAETNPPLSFDAEPNGFTTDLSWLPPVPNGVLYYDDGSPEGSISIGTTADGELAVRFTPNVYPTTILEIHTLFADRTFPVTATDLKIYNGDSTTGPDSLLHTEPVTIAVRNSVDFTIVDISTAAITVAAGDFFASFVEPVTEGLGLAWDVNSPSANRSWLFAPGIGFPWQTFLDTGIGGFDNNSIIRALVQEGSGPNARIRLISSDGTSKVLARGEQAVSKYSGFASAMSSVSLDGSLAGGRSLEELEAMQVPLQSSKAGNSGFQLRALEGYNVYRSSDGGASYAQIASVADSVTSYNDATAPINQTNYYYATAQYTLGEGDPSNIDSVTIFAAAPFPFTEEWPDSGVIAPEKWSATAAIEVIDTNGVSFNTFPYPVPSAPYFVSVNGANQALTSNIIDISAESNVALSMQESEHDLEPGESVFLEYKDAGGNWLLLNEFPGTDNGFGVFEPFEAVSFPLPSDAYHAGFQFRFRTGATNATTDEWFFDNIVLDVDARTETNAPEMFALALNGFNVDLSWSAPLPEGGVLIAYDDGANEGNISIGATAEGDIAVRFTPAAYPSTLLQIITFFGAPSATSSPVSDLTIYDGDGTAGPGTALYTQSYTIGNRGFFDVVDVSSANVQITADDFFAAYHELNGQTLNVGWDQSSASANRSWVNAPGIGFPWQPFGNINPSFDNNVMIRAVVREGSGPNARIALLAPDGTSKPLTISEYKALLHSGAPVASQAGSTHLDGSAISTAPVKATQRVAGAYAKAGSGLGVKALSGYKIYRSDNGGASYGVIASPDSAATGYTDNAAPRNEPVFYYMTAVYTGGEGNPTDTLSVTIVSIVERLAEHNTPEFRSAATNEGTIGMLNAFGGTPGFEWPLGTNQLFEGGVMIGVGPDQVSDASRVIVAGAQAVLDEDFAFTTDIDTLSFGSGETAYSTGYDDSNHPNGPQADDGPNAALPVSVVESTYSYTDADNSGYLIFKYEVTNSGSSTLTDLRVGHYMDWDVNTFVGNTGEVVFEIVTIAGENNDQSFEYEQVRLFDAPGPVPYIGAVPLSQNVFGGSRVVDNANEVFPGGASPLSEANKYNYMGERRANDPFGDPFGPADKSLVYGMGGGSEGGQPDAGYTLAPGETAVAGMAIVGGNNAADFAANSLAALQKWSDLGNNIIVFEPIYTGIEDDLAGLPTEFSLDQNYPNPFNPTTTIRYGLKSTVEVSLQIYNVLGQEVRTLVNEQQNAGFQTLQWDGRNNNGDRVSSGVYIYKLVAGDFVQSRKLVLMK